MPSTMTPPQIDTRIQHIRGAKVIIDADLAQLYGVPTKALDQSIKRNPRRFRADCMFRLHAQEKAEGLTHCDPLHKRKYSRALLHAFTEHGAIQAANVLA